MRKIALLFAVTSALSASAAQPNDSLKGQYYRLFTPLTFYHNVAGHALSLNETNPVDDVVDNALLAVYLNRPDLVKTTESDLQETGSVREDVDQPIENMVDFVEQVEAPVIDFQEEAPVEVEVKKPKFWTFKGDYYELIVDVRGFKWMVQTTDAYFEDQTIGIALDPDAIHVMHKSEFSGLYGDYSTFSDDFDEDPEAEDE